MMKLIRRLVSANGKSLRKDKRGVAALEYGLMAGVVAVVVIVGFNSFGSTVSSKLTAIGTLVGTATTGATVTAAP